MSIILSLDTSTKVCSVALHKDGLLIGQQTYHLQKSHSTLLPVIIQQLIENCELDVSDLSAIALSAGPGSYTGLRIGTATAKGLSYTLNLPLIAVSALDTMVEQVAPYYTSMDVVLLPMIDARRMEVYVKAVDDQKQELWDVRPLVVEEDSFEEFDEKTLYLFGDGAAKLLPLFENKKHFRFIKDIHPSAAAMGELALKKFLGEQFEDVAYFEPEYLKEFRTNVPSQKFKV